MNSTQLQPLLSAMVRPTLPFAVQQEAISLAIKFTADDYQEWREKNRAEMIDMWSDFTTYVDTELLLRHLVHGDINAARDLALRFFEDLASDRIDNRTPEEQEPHESLVEQEGGEWGARQVWPIGLFGSVR